MKIRKVFAALGIGALIALGVQAPAQAVITDCSAYPGTICFHQYSNYTGVVWRQYPYQISGCVNMTDWGWNDRAGTAFNSTQAGYQLYLYEHVGCNAPGQPQGADFILASGQYVQFTGSLAWWNDKVSSIRVLAF